MPETVNTTDELKAVYNELIRDCERAENARGECDDQYARRISIRSVFAMIEGLTFMMKKVVLTTLDDLPEARDKLSFSQDEVVLLSEESYSLKENGSACTTALHLKLLPNLRFAIGCYARIWTADFQPDCGDQGWEALRRGVVLRNRITHPKSTDDLRVSDDDMTCFATGAKWHRDTMERLLRECNRKSEELEDG